MNTLRVSALKLRKQGKSYNEIQKELKVSKSTLSLWLRSVVLTDAACARLAGRVHAGVLTGLVRHNVLQTHHAQQRSRNIRATAQSKIKKYSKKDLLFMGIALYWAEGYKRPIIRAGREITSHTIRFVNSDAAMVRVFIAFLITILEVRPQNLRLSMRLYPHINEKEAFRFWSIETGVPKEQFFKTTYLISSASKKVRPYNRLPWGTLEVEVCDTEKFHYLMGLIEGMKKQFPSGILPRTPG